MKRYYRYAKDLSKGMLINQYGKLLQVDYIEQNKGLWNHTVTVYTSDLTNNKQRDIWKFTEDETLMILGGL